ncbi:transposase [Streptosporangium canum]|uniref:transposase n=1 Tax=Streptosporangium canum TaxID=324952 RepID=UPI003F4E0035
MPVLPSFITTPLWDQFAALIPPVVDAHPLGCHRPRIPDRLVFERLLARLVLGGTYQRHADDQVSATTLLGCVLAGANRNDSPLLRPTLETLARFGFRLPPRITVHLDAGYDSKPTRALLTELGCQWKISPKGQFVPINHTHRWAIERTNSWHTRGFTSLAIVADRRGRVQAAWVALACAVIVIRRLIRQAQPAYRLGAVPGSADTTCTRAFQPYGAASALGGRRRGGALGA